MRIQTSDNNLIEVIQRVLSSEHTDICVNVLN